MATLLKRVERPRELNWLQAGAMLYGDWGTSKAYVLGIAFALAGHASWLFLGVMSILIAMVGICYIIVCRMYPDGGGVYSSAKNRSRPLAVVGALLLIADYVVTVSLSALDAFHYFNVQNPLLWAVCAIVLIGVINWVGPTKGGSLAFVIAVLASVAAGVLFLSTLPSLPHLELQWPQGGMMKNWSIFVGIVLALSGVESIANMTGIMIKPVKRTSRKAIIPVLLEVSILTFLLGVAMNAIPGLTNHTEDMLRVLGDHYIAPWYGQLISVLFGFLLLSAANTAIMGLVNVQFLLARDGELPSVFARLNRFGMPTLALVIAVAVPIVVLLVERDIVSLAALYAIGVVGAIVVNLGFSLTNRQFPLKIKERLILGITVIVLLFVEITIAFEKRNALIFVLIIVGTGLLLRYIAKIFVPRPLEVPLEFPVVNLLTVSEAKEIVPLYKSSSLVAIKSLNLKLLEEVAMRVKALGENSVYLDYVEESPPSPELPHELEPSRESLHLLGRAQQEFEKRGITAIPIWQLGRDPGRLIAHAASELGVRAVLIGTTQRSTLMNLLRGDVFRILAKNLPSECRLIISG